MKTFSAAVLAATALTAGLVAGAVPAAAATRCGCPVVYHHRLHRPLRHGIAYDRAYAPEVIYGEAPVYEPGYYGAPVWYGGYGGYYGGYGPGWGGGWAHGYRGAGFHSGHRR